MSPCDRASLGAEHVTHNEKSRQVEAGNLVRWFGPKDWLKASHQIVHQYE